MKAYYISFVCILLVTAKGRAQVSAINQKGTKILIDSSKWALSGTNIFNKNTGNVGVGNASPTYKLDVTGKVRITDSLVTNRARVLSLSGGSLNDSLVVADASTGVLKRIAPNQLIQNDGTTASNGLGLVGKDVRLGGTLASATSIATSATNTLALTGLQPGNVTTDSALVAAGTSGVIKKVSLNTPQLIVVAARTTTYTPATAYANLAYNIATINLSASYNTATGIFTAPAAGLYQVMFANLYLTNSSSDNQLRARIIVNGSTETEVALTMSPYGLGSGTGTLSGNTIVSLSVGQNISIQTGGLANTMLPQVGAGQHTFKIIRLQ